MEPGGGLVFPLGTFCMGQDNTGRWWFKHPDTHAWHLDNHVVTRNDDGTITVRPSILQTKRRTLPNLTGARGRVHGYITDSEWKDC
jgi:hypothetical protein